MGVIVARAPIREFRLHATADQPLSGSDRELGKLLGTRQLSVVPGRHELALIDTPLDR
jgi:hypothetical protein